MADEKVIRDTEVDPAVKEREEAFAEAEKLAKEAAAVKETAVADMAEDVSKAAEEAAEAVDAAITDAQTAAETATEDAQTAAETATEDAQTAAETATEDEQPAPAQPVQAAVSGNPDAIPTEQPAPRRQKIGTVRIADDVVAMIAAYTVREIDGVSSMAGSTTGEWLGKVGYKNPTKGVRVEVADGAVKVDLSVNMGYGYNIPATCSKIQTRVKQAIENMTGLAVTDINVRIAGITIPTESETKH